MKKFKEFKIGDEFYSTCSISEKELESYLKFTRIKNVFLENTSKNEQKIISGRAIIARMEGEFTRLSQIYGNDMLLIGSDGDEEWKNRNIRFLKPLHTDEILDIKFTISNKEEIDEEYGKIFVDYEGTSHNGETIVISKKNIYRIKKEPPRN